MSVCGCVCARARACVRACVCAYLFCARDFNRQTTPLIRTLALGLILLQIIITVQLLFVRASAREWRGRRERERRQTDRQTD